MHTKITNTYIHIFESKKSSDCNGNELNPGDYVMFATSDELRYGVFGGLYISLDHSRVKWYNYHYDNYDYASIISLNKGEHKEPIKDLEKIFGSREKIKNKFPFRYESYLFYQSVSGKCSKLFRRRYESFNGVVKIRPEDIPDKVKKILSENKRKLTLSDLNL